MIKTAQRLGFTLEEVADLLETAAHRHGQRDAGLAERARVKLIEVEQRIADLQVIRTTWIGAGIIALGLYGFVATFQPDADFGRVLAAYGGVFVAGSLAWGIVMDGFRPDRWDLIGAAICLAGVLVIMYAPRS
ncbi:MerR family DNA-binding protein [Streptosporangium roseum]|uniref:MerR family DNA-binding protein n=1 Tax=Streptosporangium roseum TaxID=2001 RepID=UPI00331E147E